MRLLAPAKINLHLRVGPSQPDGFHSLLSWICTVGLFDTLTLNLNSKVAHATAGPPAVISLATDQLDLPTDGRNLVVRVAKALADTPGDGDGRAGRREGVSAFLAKRIPMGAGMGGGSSDAARTLLGLNNLWGIGWSARRLSEFSWQFGSDLPFFFHGPSSICTGRGERVGPIGRPAPRHAVVVMPEIHLATPAVYRRFDEMGLGGEQTLSTEPDWGAWTKLPARLLLPMLVNDLEPAAFSLVAELGELRQQAERMLGRAVRMSGSGSSLFTLFDEREEGGFAAERVRSELKVKAQHVELAPELQDDLNG